MSRLWFEVLGSLCAAAALLGVRKAERARQRGERYVFTWWDGIPGLYGRAVAPTIPLVLGVIAFLGGVAIATEAPARLGFFRMGRSQFTFTMPRGWVDVSRGQPTTNMDLLPPAVAESVRKTRYAAAAFDVAHPDANGRFGAAVAVERAGSVDASESLIESESRRTVRDASRFSNGFDVAVTETDLPVISGHRVARLSVRISVTKGSPPILAMLVYVVPARTEYAVVSYTLPVERLDSYRPEVDASIEAVVAAAQRE